MQKALEKSENRCKFAGRFFWILFNGLRQKKKKLT